MSESLDLGTSGRTELRVHGVSGTPPAGVLDFPLLRQVAGDAKAGLFRRFYPGGRSEDLTSDRRLEAYSWGGLTSGGASRAFWLLLLPFMLANLAHWMLPAMPDGARRGRAIAAAVSAALLRVFGLALTLTLVLTGAEVAMDVVLWQCGGDPRCVDRSRVLSPFVAGVLESPGRRVVVGALVPLALVLLVGLLGRSSQRRTTATANEPVVRRSDEPLASPAFWRGNPGLAVLRTAHVAAATAVLAGLVAWPATTLVATGAARWVGITVVLLSAVAFLTALVLVVRGTATGREADAASTGAFSAATASRVRWGALGLLVVASVYSAWGWPDDWEFAARIPGLRPAINTSFVVTTLVLLGLVITVVVQRPWEQSDRVGYRPAMAGMSAPAVAAMAFLAGGGFSAGLTFRVAEMFGTPVLTGRTRVEMLIEREQVIADPTAPFTARLDAATSAPPLAVPPSFAWAGAATTVLSLVALVMIVVTVMRVRRRIGPLAESVLAGHPDEQIGRTVRDRDVRRVARMEAMAALSDDAGRIIGRLMTAGGVVVLAGAVLYATLPDTWVAFEFSNTELTEMMAGLLTVAVRVGTWLMGVYVIALVAVFWSSYRNPTMRRTVGILWDIGCFWPRAAHPLSPPSYGERAVPDLVARSETLTADGRVILSGHSQGSVLVAATVLQLPAATLERTALITHGSPLRRLYARFFPAYFGWSTMDRVREDVGDRWVNLYRDTDPIGSWVLDGTTRPTADVDRFLVDPRTLAEAINGHSDYWLDPAYEPAITGLERVPDA